MVVFAVLLRGNFAPSSVKISHLKLWLCKKSDKYEVCFSVLFPLTKFILKSLGWIKINWSFYPLQAVMQTYVRLAGIILI